MSNTARVYAWLLGCMMLLAAAFALSYEASRDQYGMAFTTISRRGNQVRWRDLPVHYAVCAEGTPDVKANGDDGNGAPVKVRDIVRGAFRAWTEVAGVQLSVEEDKPLNCAKERTGNTISWVAQNWEAQSFKPPMQALAVTITTFYPGKGEMSRAEIYFNNESFSWGYVNSKEEEWGGARISDIASVVTHEIGHFLGFDHSSEDPWEEDDKLRNATMYYASWPGDTSQRTLEADDLKLVRHHYPEVDPGTPELLEISPAAAVGGYRGDVYEVVITGDNFSSNAHVILSNGSDPDIHGNVVEGTAEELRVRFNLIGAWPDSYDLVVSNTPAQRARAKAAFRVASNASEAAEYATASELHTAGGCGTLNGNPAPLFILLLILFYPMLRWRRCQAPIRIRLRRR